LLGTEEIADDGMPPEQPVRSAIAMQTVIAVDAKRIVIPLPLSILKGKGATGVTGHPLLFLGN
jgi:hypothetical protein